MATRRNLKRTITTPTRPRRKVATKSPTRVTSKATSKRKLSVEERLHMIAEAAYYIAQQRNFQGGNPEEDWLEAERRINATL